MKRLMQLIMAISFVLLCACCRSSNRVYAKGEWRLELYPTYAKGTESEGTFGILFKDDVPVYPKKVGDVTDTELGRIKYYGNPTDPHQMFDPIGWNFEDLEKRK